MIGPRSVDGDIGIQYHPKRKVRFGFRYHNRTKQFENYYGALKIFLPEGREMSFAGAFGRENENKYVSNVEFEIIKGRRTRIDTLLKIATQHIYEFEVGVSLPDLEPVRVIGAYNKLEHGHSLEASFRKAEKLYRTYVEVIYEEGKTGKLIVDVAVPQRRVKLSCARSKVETESHVILDFQWNADKNLDDRFLANVTYDIKTIDDFELSTTLHYPSRTIDFSIKHNSAARYITNIELQWSPKEKMELNIIFRDDVFSGSDRTELTVSFLSPFKDYEEAGIFYSMIKNLEQVQTKSSFTWGKGKKIFATTKAKLPMRIESIDFTGTLSTPFKKYDTLFLTVTHRFNKELNTSSVVQWGRNRLSVNVDGQLTMTKIRRDFNGNVEIRTPFEGMRSLRVTAEHSDNYKKFTTMLAMDTSKFNTQSNEGKYTFEMDMDHNVEGTGLVNTANIKVTMPNDDFTMDWELSHTLGRSRAMLDILPRRGNRFKIEMFESHMLLPTGNTISSKFELLIPTEAIQELLISFSHEDRLGHVNTVASLTKDNLELMSANVGYENSHGALQLDSLITSAYSEDIVMKLTSAHGIMPYRSNFVLRWGETPWKITSESSIFYDMFGRYEAEVKVFTPIPEVQILTLGVKRQKSGLNWDTSTKLSFAQQTIQLDAIYRYDHVKFTKIMLTTNYPQFPGLTTSFRLDGGIHDFNGDAYFVMVPYVKKISTDFRWSYYEGSRVSGEFNLNTPFPQYPHLKTSFNSNQMGVSRVSKFELEYLPTQIVKIETDHRFSSLETLEGTIKITSPFTENKQVVAGFTHIGNREEFATKAKITCECFKRPVFTEATFSSKNGLKSTFVMDSPFRGYETVKWNLDHKDLKNGYHTIASYETNGKEISYENVLTMKDKIQWQVTFLTPFANITRTHLLVTYEGMFPNAKSRMEVAYNEKMVASDFELTHNMDKTVASVAVTTPFERYQNINGIISRTGTLSDLTVTGDLNYSLKWHADLRHVFNGQDVYSSIHVECPYLKEGLAVTLNHTGPLLDSHTLLDYDMGSAYQSVSETRFLYNLPNFIASCKCTTSMADSVRVNQGLLKHIQKQDAKMTEISSQLLFETSKDIKVNFEVFFNVDQPENQIGSYDMTYFAIVELPHPNFNYSKLAYESRQRMRFAENMELIYQSTGSMFTFETPLLEKLTEVNSAEYDVKTYSSKQKRTYGDMEWTADLFWQKGFITYKITTPHEGFESTDIEMTYTHPESGELIKIFNTDTTITVSSLKAPVVISTRNTNNFRDKTVSDLDGSIKFVYSSEYDMLLVYSYKPGLITSNLKTNLDGVESSDLTLTYTDSGADVLITSNALKKPITCKTVWKTHSWRDFEFTHKLTSPFDYVKYHEYVIKQEVVDGTYKPVLVMKYESKLGTIRETSLGGSWAWDVKDAGEMKLETGLAMKIPYDAFKGFNLRVSHGHSMAPLRLVDGLTVEFNSTKYLDVDAEFGALNKFTGLVFFRAPRKMEYRFSALNEGESVDAELMLNWNKQEPQNNFLMEFGMSDTGNKVQKRKNVQIKVTSPGRVMLLSNKYESRSGNVNSYGTLAWDTKKGQQVSYELVSTVPSKNEHNVQLTVTVPARTVEMSGSYRNDGSEIDSTGSLLWNAEEDRDKRVEVKLTISPTGVNKKANVNLRLPSFNKV